MRWHTLSALVLAASCGKASTNASQPAPQFCDGDRLSIVTNDAPLAVDVYFQFAERNMIIGSVTPGSRTEFVLPAGIGWVSVRWQNPSDLQTNGPADIRRVRVRYDCRGRGP
jgi:hypothetical protein